MKIGVKAGFLLAKDIFNDAPGGECLISFEEMCADMPGNSSALSIKRYAE